MTTILFLKARDRRDIGTADMFGTHIETHTRKDGVVQTYHVSAPQPKNNTEKKIVFVKPHDVPEMSNNEPMDTNGGIMKLTITAAAVAEYKRISADIQPLLDQLAEYTAAGAVIKSRYADLRTELTRIYDVATQKVVKDGYLASREAWAEDVYYAASGFVSMNKVKKLCQPHIGNKLADDTLALIAEWEPVVAALNALKDKITTTAAVRTEKKETEARAKAAIPPTKLSIAVHAAIQEHKPQIAARFAENVQRQHAWLVGKYGPGLKKMSNDAAKHYQASLADVCDRNREIVPSLVDAAAKQYADDVAEALQSKIMGKAGDLQNPAVASIRFPNFVLVGEMKGKPVRIEQNMIVNTSTLGTLFNQFPARIYHDGKFVSEAQYKTIQTAA